LLIRKVALINLLAFAGSTFAAGDGLSPSEQRVVDVSLLLDQGRAGLEEASSRDGVECQVNSKPVVFDTVQHTPGISEKQAELKDGVTLIWSYNIFYDIGGSVYLTDQRGQSESILNWDNAFKEDVLVGSAHYDDLIIECKVIKR
jgi:hypothetical protein